MPNIFVPLYVSGEIIRVGNTCYQRVGESFSPPTVIGDIEIVESCDECHKVCQYTYQLKCVDGNWESTPVVIDAICVLSSSAPPQALDTWVVYGEMAIAVVRGTAACTSLEGCSPGSAPSAPAMQPSGSCSPSVMDCVYELILSYNCATETYSINDPAGVCYAPSTGPVDQTSWTPVTVSGTNCQWTCTRRVAGVCTDNACPSLSPGLIPEYPSPCAACDKVCEFKWNATCTGENTWTVAPDGSTGVCVFASSSPPDTLNTWHVVGDGAVYYSRGTDPCTTDSGCTYPAAPSHPSFDCPPYKVCQYTYQAVCIGTNTWIPAGPGSTICVLASSAPPDTLNVWHQNGTSAVYYARSGDCGDTGSPSECPAAVAPALPTSNCSEPKYCRFARTATCVNGSWVVGSVQKSCVPMDGSPTGWQYDGVGGASIVYWGGTCTSVDDCTDPGYPQPDPEKCTCPGCPNSLPDSVSMAIHAGSATTPCTSDPDSSVYQTVRATYIWASQTVTLTLDSELCSFEGDEDGGFRTTSGVLTGFTSNDCSGTGTEIGQGGNGPGPIQLVWVQLACRWIIISNFESNGPDNAQANLSNYMIGYLYGTSPYGTYSDGTVVSASMP